MKKYSLGDELIIASSFKKRKIEVFEGFVLLVLLFILMAFLTLF